MYRCRSAAVNDSQYDIFVIQIHTLLSPTPTTPPNYDALPRESTGLMTGAGETHTRSLSLIPCSLAFIFSSQA